MGAVCRLLLEESPVSMARKRSGEVGRRLICRCCFVVAGDRLLREKKTLLMALLFGRRWERKPKGGAAACVDGDELPLRGKSWRRWRRNGELRWLGG